jgi:alkanesulfonate monooxygenase SsuD/methylene tetrahydromethanopterin reductase-like flavin-dependent oxidoreductase (luciferase family)
MVTRTGGLNNYKFGIFFPPVSPWPVLRERAMLVEQLGFESIWMGDKFASPGDANVPWFECWALMSGFATCTERVRVGTLVTSIIYRNPAIIAKQALTVDHMSGGRFTLGLGVSSADDTDHLMTGVYPWPAAERVNRFKEVVTIVDQMLRNPVTTFAGQYYQVTDAVMLPPPIQKPRPPLLIAAEGPRMLKIAAAYADNWNSLGGFEYSSEEALQHTQDNNLRLTEYALELGRDPGSITRSFCVGWTHDRPFESLGAFEDFIGRYAEVGIQEFMLGYWHEQDEPRPVPMSHIKNADMLERIAEYVNS